MLFILKMSNSEKVLIGLIVALLLLVLYMYMVISQYKSGKRVPDAAAVSTTPASTSGTFCS